MLGLNPFTPEQRKSIAVLDTAISKLMGVKIYRIDFMKRKPEIEIRIMGGDGGDIGRCIAKHLPEGVNTKGTTNKTIKLAGEDHYQEIHYTHNPKRL